MGCDYSKDLPPRNRNRHKRPTKGRSQTKTATGKTQRVATRQSNLYRTGEKLHEEIHMGSGHMMVETPPPQHSPDTNKRSDNNNKGQDRSSVSSIFRKSYDVTAKQLLRQVRENIIGINATFEGPFGLRRTIYCDFVASGKPIKFIEDYITENVLPFYANTHTTTSVSALQTSTFRQESREIIKKCLNASEDDVVIFTGSGATAAVHKVINAIDLRGDKAANTVVIISPYEHHSNILPWRASGAKVERLKEMPHGEIDVGDLITRLEHHSGSETDVIVALSAASNVTGIITNTKLISEVVHQYNALIFWDYACAGPYIEIDINPSPTGYTDAAFISAHKFIGGPGTPGILVAKKGLFTNVIPGGVGGGTVAYVSRTKVGYLSNIEEREEGGTPAIVESIRAGMAFQLKQSIGARYIESVEDDLCKRTFKTWKNNANIHILGSHTSRRLPIFSLLISHPDSHKFLHHNFVSVLLNDLYGIQARGGCACAGPYAMDLLCMDDDMADRFLNLLQHQRTNENGEIIKPLEILKPGFMRLNFSYFLDKDTVDFILRAVDRVATDGWKLLPLYEFDDHTGSWRHRHYGTIKVAHLKDAKIVDGVIVFGKSDTLQREGQVNLQDILTQAENIFDQAAELSEGLDIDDRDVAVGDEDKDIVWFLQPKTALLHLRAPSVKYLQTNSKALPFLVRQNTTIMVRNRFVETLGQLGHTLERTKALPQFMSSQDDLFQLTVPDCDECAWS